MDVQRSHFRRHLSITLVVLFMLTLAALRIAGGHPAAQSPFVLPLLLIAFLFYVDLRWPSTWYHNSLNLEGYYSLRTFKLSPGPCRLRKLRH